MIEYLWRLNVYQLSQPLKDARKDSSKLNGYFSVINDSSEKSNFKVMNVGPICDQGSTDKYLYSKILNGQQYNHCTSCNVNDNFYHYYPDESPRVCTFCNEDLGYQWSEERRECDTCDVNNPANHYEPSTGRCDKCDESIPTNHYFSDSHQCLSCNTSFGWKIFNPGPDQPKKCVSCRNGTLRADGTCDYRPPVITYTVQVFDPAKGRCSGDYQAGMGLLTCSVYFHCEGGVFPRDFGADLNRFIYSQATSCEYGSTEPKYTGLVGETEVECRNPEGEITKMRFACLPEK